MMVEKQYSQCEDRAGRDSLLQTFSLEVRDVPFSLIQLLQVKLQIMEKG